MSVATEEHKKAALDRIRKLIAHAKDLGDRYNEAEIELYMAKAKKMMDEFDVSEKDVILNESEQASKDLFNSVVEEDVYDRAGKIDSFDSDLAHVVCILFDVKRYRTRRSFDKKTGKAYKNRKGWVQEREFIIFYGFPRDVAVAKEMYHELLTSMRMMCRVRYGEGEWQKVFSSYCQGFVARLNERAYEIKKASKTESSDPTISTAIVLRKDIILKKFAEEKLCLTHGKRRASRDVSNGGAYDDGRSDGGKVQLGAGGLPRGQQGRLE